jgi:hypothetical protein
MPISQAQRDGSKRDWLLRGDLLSNISNKLDDRSPEEKDEKARIDRRQDEIKEKPKEEESKQGKTPAQSPA